MRSLFDKTGTIVPPDPRAQVQHEVIKVGGELEVDPDYKLPLLIHFMVVQGPEGKEDSEPTDVESEAGYVVIADENAKRWDGTLTVKPGRFEARDARGIAVAVAAKKSAFAYETLTWCVHIKLTIGQAAD